MRATPRRCRDSENYLQCDCVSYRISEPFFALNTPPTHALCPSIRRVALGLTRAKPAIPDKQLHSCGSAYVVIILVHLTGVYSQLICVPSASSLSRDGYHVLTTTV